MEWRCAFMHSIDLPTSGPLATLQSLAGCQVLLAGSGCALLTCSEFVALDGWSSLLAHKGTSSSVTKECGLWPYIFCRCLVQVDACTCFVFWFPLHPVLTNHNSSQQAARKAPVLTVYYLQGLASIICVHLSSVWLSYQMFPNLNLTAYELTRQLYIYIKKSVVFHLQMTAWVHVS